MKTIGVVGSRRRDSDRDFQLVKAEIIKHLKPGDRLVSGGCPRGGDRFAEIVAKKLGLCIIIFYPDWEGLGRRAGFERNTYIARDSDVLIACVAPDRTGGTEDTVRKFLATHDESALYLV
jgi:hypothetical protein